jgi:nucleotide-binding universal stress UspA family protein
MSIILVPLDGSALAEQVIPYVRQLAPLLHAGVRLLHVVPDAALERLLADEDMRLAEWERHALPHATRVPCAWDSLRGQAEDYLETQASQLRAEALGVSLSVRRGVPADMILAAAEPLSCSLIAMATHGYSGLRRWTLGSVADKVVRGTAIPTLVVRGSGPLRAAGFRRIMVALDGSALAQQALPLALELAVAAHAELILLEAISPTIESYPCTPLPSGILAALCDQASIALHTLADQFGSLSVPVTPVVVVGYAAEAIVEEAAHRHVDMIVMATHGWGGLRRWALGSVADKVLHATTTPLLLVRIHGASEEAFLPASLTLTRRALDHSLSR